jgi:hypothetical protein
LAWDTIRIFLGRTNDFGLIGYEDDMSEVIRQENIWGFGQVVAVGLLVLPIFSFFGKSHSNFAMAKTELTLNQKRFIPLKSRHPKNLGDKANTIDPFAYYQQN